MTLREQFEAAYVEDMVRIMGEGIRKRAVDNTRFLMQNGDFQDPALRLALWAWQASRESLVIELPTLRLANSYANHHCFGPEDLAAAYKSAILDCHSAIESAGVKVTP